MKKLSYLSFLFLILLSMQSMAQLPYQVQHYVHQWPFNGEHPKQVLFDDNATSLGIVTLGEIDPIGGVSVACNSTFFISPGGVNIMHLTKHDATNPSALLWSNSYLPTGTVTLNPDIQYEVTDICERKTGGVAQRGYVICGNITETFTSGGTIKYGFLLKTTLTGSVVWFRMYWSGTNANAVPGSDEIGFNAIVDVPNTGYIVVGYRKIFNSANHQVARMMKVGNTGVPVMTKEVNAGVADDSEFKDICAISAVSYALIGNCGTRNIPGTTCLGDADILFTTCNANIGGQVHRRIGVMGGGNIETGKSLVWYPAISSLVVTGEHYLQISPCVIDGDLLVFSITTAGAIGWSNIYGIAGVVPDLHPQQIVLGLKQDPPNPNGPFMMWNVIGYKNAGIGFPDPWLLVGDLTGGVHTFQDIPAPIFPGYHQPVSLVERPFNALWPGFENNIIWYGSTIDANGLISASLIERSTNQAPVACGILPVNFFISPVFLPVATLPNSNRTTANLAISYSPYCLPINVTKPCTGPLREGEDEIKALNENDWNVYPNPTSGLVYIQMPAGIEGQFTVEVFDISGKLMFSQITESNSALSVDLTDFDSGVYLIRLIGSDNGEVKTLRVIRN